MRFALAFVFQLVAVMSKSRAHMNSASPTLLQAAYCINTQPWGCWARRKNTGGKKPKQNKETHTFEPPKFILFAPAEPQSYLVRM